MLSLILFLKKEEHGNNIFLFNQHYISNITSMTSKLKHDPMMSISQQIQSEYGINVFPV